MANFVSRSEIYAHEIEQVNQDIEILRATNKDSEYLASIIKLLNDIDYQYFNDIILEVRDHFEINKYYLEADRNQELVNHEIPYLIENYLQSLSQIEPLQEPNSKPSEFKIESKFYRQKMADLTAIEQRQKKQIIDLGTTLTDPNQNVIHSQFDPKVLLGLIKQNEKYDTNSLLKLTRNLMLKEIKTAHVAKENYRINYKWFLVVGITLLIGLVTAVCLPFFI